MSSRSPTPGSGTACKSSPRFGTNPTPTTSLTDTLDLSTAGFGGAANGISVTVMPFDGEAFGTPVTASTTISQAAPVAQPATVSLSHNTPAGISIPLSATDADNATLTYSVYTAGGITNGGAADGTVTINGSTATYVPTGARLHRHGHVPVRRHRRRAR